VSCYLPHQIAASDQVLAVLRKKGLCLLAGETRTGKTRAAIRVAELSKCLRILVLTKKQAIPGWHSELDAVQPSKDYTVINYEQAHKQTPGYDLVILDESHNFGNRGKPTRRFSTARQLTQELPLLCLSGTPSVESLLGFYYQFGLTKFSPFNSHKNFYDFFRKYGISTPRRLHGRMVETYSRANDDLFPVIAPYIVKLTQAQAGITHTAQDTLHRVELSDATQHLIHTVKEDKVVTVNGQEVAMESEAKERAFLHQLESGAVKINDALVELPNTEMIDYIRTTWGDHNGIAIMCHYHATRMKVAKHLPNCHVYSSDGHAEGVNLSHYQHFIILNSGYSGAKFIQRRDRIVNINRTTEAIVHHIVAKGQLSEAVYKAVSNKRDFNLAMYRKLK